MSTIIDGIIIQRISFLQEQIRTSNKPAVNKMFQLQIDMLRSADLSKLDRLIEWKKKEVKGCIDTHESERLFTELEALEWLERQIRRL